MEYDVAIVVADKRLSGEVNRQSFPLRERAFSPGSAFAIPTAAMLVWSWTSRIDRRFDGTYGDSNARRRIASVESAPRKMAAFERIPVNGK